MTNTIQFSSVHFGLSVVSDSLRPHEPQHTRPPCPSPTPGVHPNSCPLNQWCHPTISSSVVPFFCLQSFPASGSFQMSQLFTSDWHNRYAFSSLTSWEGCISIFTIFSKKFAKSQTWSYVILDKWKLIIKEKLSLNLVKQNYFYP